MLSLRVQGCSLIQELEPRDAQDSRDSHPVRVVERSLRLYAACNLLYQVADVGGEGARSDETGNRVAAVIQPHEARVIPCASHHVGQLLGPKRGQTPTMVQQVWSLTVK